MRRLAHTGWFVFGGGPSPGAVLAAVEGSLSVQEVALSRWRAWARAHAGWVSTAKRMSLLKCAAQTTPTVELGS